MEKYILKRQDDHGHVFEVGSFENREDAEQACTELTAKGHKQMYWVEEMVEEETQYPSPAPESVSPPKATIVRRMLVIWRKLDKLWFTGLVGLVCDLVGGFLLFEVVEEFVHSKWPSMSHE